MKPVIMSQSTKFQKLDLDGDCHAGSNEAEEDGEKKVQTDLISSTVSEFEHSLQSIDSLNDECLSMVLSYLPIGLKFKLLSVNRRFKKNMFNQDKRLIIGRDPGCTLAPISRYLMTQDVNGKLKVNHPVLKSILSNFTQLETIDLTHCDSKAINSNQSNSDSSQDSKDCKSDFHLDAKSLKMIANSKLPKLNCVKLGSTEIKSKKFLEKFAKFHAKKILKIEFGYQNDKIIQCLLGKCVNLNEISADLKKVVSYGHMLSNMKSVRGQVDAHSVLKTFCEMFADRVEKLIFPSFSGMNMFAAIQQISKLNRLRHLDMRMGVILRQTTPDDQIPQEQLDTNLINLNNNQICHQNIQTKVFHVQKLNNLELHLSFEVKQACDLNILSTCFLQLFLQANDYHLESIHIDLSDFSIDLIETTSLASLKDCQNVKNLSLIIHGYPSNFFHHFNSIFPNLKTLAIKQLSGGINHCSNTGDFLEFAKLQFLEKISFMMARSSNFPMDQIINFISNTRSSKLKEVFMDLGMSSCDENSFIPRLIQIACAKPSVCLIVNDDNVIYLEDDPLLTHLKHQDFKVNPLVWLHIMNEWPNNLKIHFKINGLENKVLAGTYLFQKAGFLMRKL